MIPSLDPWGYHRRRQIDLREIDVWIFLITNSYRNQSEQNQTFIISPDFN